MISVPTVSEDQVRERLEALGYKPTNTTTATGRFWKNQQHGRHLLVPNANHSIYPQWLIDDLVHNAVRVGDEAVANAVRGIEGWERMMAARDRSRRPRPKPKSSKKKK